MRKTIFWIIGIIAVIMMLAKASDIQNLFITVQQGALIPIILAVIFQIGRYVMQAVSYSSCYDAIGEKGDWKSMVPLVFSGIFINTIAPTGGMAGAVLVIDNARKRNISPGKATTAAILSSMGTYAGFMLIMVIGFIILGATGMLNVGTLIGGLVMVLIVAGFTTALFMCHRHDRTMLRFFRWCERKDGSLRDRIHRPRRNPWAAKITSQLKEASDEIVANPVAVLGIVGFATIGSGLEMLNFICVGFAFGVVDLNVLIASYVVTYIFTIVSPSPNGVGIAEATATLMLTSFGTPVSVATAVALVFRGFVFWIPFAVGAVLLRRTGFFEDKKKLTVEAKSKQTAWIAGVFVFALGIINTYFAILPGVPKNLELLGAWFASGEVLSPTFAVVLSILLTLMTRGIILRSRTTYSWTMVLLIFLAAAQLLSGRSYLTAIPIFALILWMFIVRRSFDQVILAEKIKREVWVPVVLAFLIVIGYTMAGFYLLSGTDFALDEGFRGILMATLQTLFPLLGLPQTLTPYGGWFLQSVYTVLWLCTAWVVLSVGVPLVRRSYYMRHGWIAADGTICRPVEEEEAGEAGEVGREGESSEPREQEPDEPKAKRVRRRDLPPVPPTLEDDDVYVLGYDAQSIVGLLDAKVADGDKFRAAAASAAAASAEAADAEAASAMEIADARLRDSNL